MTGARKVRTNRHHAVPIHVQMLCAIRTQRHWTQKQLAIEIGVRRNTVSSWERGITEPREPWVKLITDLFQMPA